MHRHIGDHTLQHAARGHFRRHALSRANTLLTNQQSADAQNAKHRGAAHDVFLVQGDAIRCEEPDGPLLSAAGGRPSTRSISVPLVQILPKNAVVPPAI